MSSSGDRPKETSQRVLEKIFSNHAPLCRFTNIEFDNDLLVHHRITSKQPISIECPERELADLLYHTVNILHDYNRRKRLRLMSLPKEYTALQKAPKTLKIIVADVAAFLNAQRVPFIDAQTLKTHLSAKLFIRAGKMTCIGTSSCVLESGRIRFTFPDATYTPTLPCEMTYRVEISFGKFFVLTQTHAEKYTIRLAPTTAAVVSKEKKQITKKMAVLDAPQDVKKNFYIFPPAGSALGSYDVKIDIPADYKCQLNLNAEHKGHLEVRFGTKLASVKSIDGPSSLTVITPEAPDLYSTATVPVILLLYKGVVTVQVGLFTYRQLKIKKPMLQAAKTRVEAPKRLHSDAFLQQEQDVTEIESPSKMQRTTDLPELSILEPVPLFESCIVIE